MASDSPRALAGYTGRFAPSPSGPLHDGSLVAAMASFLDARAHGGRWLLRIEDIDGPRVVPGADRLIMQQLQALGMQWDEPPVWQSHRLPLYQQAFDRLLAEGRAYPCGCTRHEVPPGARYPGTCRDGLHGRRPRAWRFRVDPGVERFTDRWVGPQAQDVEADIGDFIIKRADGLWAYQLAVVVDDGDQGITHIVRGADLLDSTPRQRMLGRHLRLPCPEVMHVPLAHDAQGRKLSKQNHAAALDLAHPLATLDKAWERLGFAALHADHPDAFWREATAQWGRRFPLKTAALSPVSRVPPVGEGYGAAAP